MAGRSLTIILESTTMAPDIDVREADISVVDTVLLSLGGLTARRAGRYQGCGGVQFAAVLPKPDNRARVGYRPLIVPADPIEYQGATPWTIKWVCKVGWNR